METHEQRLITSERHAEHEVTGLGTLTRLEALGRAGEQ